MKLTPGSDGIGPNGWVGAADALTQTFGWGSREDGLNFVTLAFGVAGLLHGEQSRQRQQCDGYLPAATAAGSAAYTRTDPPIAKGNPKYLGAAWRPGTASLNFANYWNQVTPENGDKWGTVEGIRATP